MCLYQRVYYIIFIIVIVSISIIYGSSKTFAMPPLRFSASVVEPFSNSENTAFEDLIVKELFKRLNLNAVIRFVPAERAMINLNEGLDDGCLSRIAGLSTIYPNIRQIPEMSLEREFMAFTMHTFFTPDGWTSLKPYNVGFITGWKILERNITQAKTISKVKNGKLLFKLLNAGRVEVIIYNRYGGLQLAKDLKIDKIKILEPSLVKVPHYFYLNKKHENLVGPASRELARMKADGTYRRIFETTLNILTK